MATWTSQPDGTDGLDTWMSAANPTVNYGTGTFMIVGLESGTTICRGLLAFDMTKPTGSGLYGPISVQSASLFITCSVYNNAKTLAAYKCLRNWVEGQATYNVWSTGNNWSTAGAGNDGADYVSTVLASCVISGTGEFELPFTATGCQLIQDWANGTLPNYGFVLRHTSETTSANRYYPSDYATAGSRPELVVNYARLDGEPCYFADGYSLA
jgi:hypothetical protein